MTLEIDDYSHSPSARRVAKPMTDSAKTKQEKAKPDNARHNVSFIQGFKDMGGYSVQDDDYYGILGTMGFYDAEKLPFGGPLTHSTDVSTVLQYYDTNLKKTPIDTRSNVRRIDNSQIAADAKSGRLYNVQNFQQQAADRIAEKTHRVLHDPIRTFQSQTLIDIQNHLNFLRNSKDISSMDKVMEYTSMGITVNMLVLDRLTDILDTSEKALIFEKEESRPVGKTFYVQLTLTAGAAPTKIDFRNPVNTKNVPAGTTLSGLPNQNLYFMNVAFDSGTNLHLKTNEPANSFETDVTLISPPQGFVIDPRRLAIESLNIRASGTDASVRIIGLY